jgi:FKBP-type peptidyl-prolyl cis-trans isomerase
MAKPHQRVFALIMALLFLATAIAGSAVVIWQIKKDNDTTRSVEEQTKLQQELLKKESEGRVQGGKLNDFSPIAKIEQLQKIDLKEGTGEEVKPGATVTAHYTGAVASTGVVFQSSHEGGQPIPFSLNGVIVGWKEGVPGMKVGGTRRLLIPAAMAYGSSPPAGSGIPANADLVFDIELVNVSQ